MKISWNNLWDMIAEVELYKGSSDIAMQKIIGILQNVPGQLNVAGSSLVFIPNPYNVSHRYSTSIIGSDDEDLRIESHTHAVNQKLEEEAVIQWILDQMNEQFEPYDSVVLHVFHDRYIRNMSVSELREEYGLGSKKYYLYISTAEYLFKDAMLINNPVYQVVDVSKYL